jgi:DNA-binding XRE family transcriptional regulator
MRGFLRGMLVRERLRIAGWCLAVAGLFAAAVVVVTGTAFATSVAALAVWADWAAMTALPLAGIGIVLVVLERISRTGKAGLSQSESVPELAGPQAADDPEPITASEAQAFGKALHDIRTALGLSVAELAMRADLGDDDIQRIEEGGTEPSIPLLRRLAAALNAEVRLTAGDGLGSIWFEPHAAGITP